MGVRVTNPVYLQYCLFLVAVCDNPFQAPAFYTTGYSPYFPKSATVGHFRTDKQLDVVVVNSADGTVTVLFANADGSLQTTRSYTTGINTGPWFVVSADFNNDNKLDLAVVKQTVNTVSMMLGNGNGIFQTPIDYTVGYRPSSVISGDFNNDHKLDLAVTNYQDNTVSVLLGNGDGTFQTQIDVYGW